MPSKHMTSKLEHALRLASDGFYIFRLAPNTSFPLAAINWREASTVNPDTIKKWFICPITGWEQDYNIGVDCYKSGVTAIDIDVKNGKLGRESYEAWETEFGWGETHVQKTPSNGFHLIYRAAGFKNSVEKLAPGIDVRGDGGFYVAAGSTKANGEYTLFNNIAPKPLPTWLEEKLTAIGKAEPISARNSGKTIIEDNEGDIAAAIEFLQNHPPAIEDDGGDQHTYVTFCKLKERGISMETAMELALEHWNPKCAPTWEPEDLRKKAENAYRYAHNATGATSPHAEFDIPKDDFGTKKNKEREGTAERSHLFNTNHNSDNHRLHEPAYICDSKGNKLAVVDNIRMALERPDICGLQIGLDTFRDEVMIAPPHTTGQWRNINDDDFTRIQCHLEREVKFKPIHFNSLCRVIHLVARTNKFDSAQLWLDRLPKWDGVKRIGRFLVNYMGAADTDYVHAVGTYLWTALAGRIIEPGIKADMVPILEGKQGIRKSSAVTTLSPSVEFFCELSLGEKDDDLSRKMRGKLVAELSELRGMKTKEIEWIKAFASRTHENWIPKYKECTAIYPRRLLLIGTTNDDQLLFDSTGNRRWLPVHVTYCDVEAIIRDRDQLWAEGRMQFDISGIDWSAERLAAEAHEYYAAQDVWQEKIADWLNRKNCDGSIPDNLTRLRNSDIFSSALGMEPKNNKGHESKRLALIMPRLGYKPTRNRALGRHWEKM